MLPHKSLRRENTSAQISCHSAPSAPEEKSPSTSRHHSRDPRGRCWGTPAPHPQLRESISPSALCPALRRECRTARGSGAGFARPDIALLPASAAQRREGTGQRPCPLSTTPSAHESCPARWLPHLHTQPVTRPSPQACQTPTSHAAPPGKSSGYPAAGIWPWPNVRDPGFARPGLPALLWVGTGYLSPRGNAPAEGRWGSSRVHGQLQDMAAGWICTVPGCSPPQRGTPPELGKIRGQERESARGGCRDAQLPKALRQPHPGDNAAHPLITHRARARQPVWARGGYTLLGWEGSIPPPSLGAGSHAEPAPGPLTGTSTA